jgi:NAD(P)-dependent dehydrogenase (short-subunit alcohol dehydrogenase family)
MAETIALVTGANKGIGKEISRQLSAKGILVLVGARDRKRGEMTVAELRGQGLPVEFVQIDVTSQASVDHTAAEVERRHGRIDILVNNAGVRLDWSAGSELTIDVLKETFETNVFGVFRVTKALSRCSGNPATVESSICRADWAPSAGIRTPTVPWPAVTWRLRTVRRKLRST